MTYLVDQDAKLPFMDEFRWKGVPEGEVRSGNRWDWFLNGLDANRIRATLIHFPVYDTVQLDAETDEKATKDDPTETDRSSASGEEQESDSESDESGQTSDGRSEAEHSPQDRLEDSQNHIEGQGLASSGSLSPGGIWDRDGPDVRYSPAFLLPLILGALESGIEDDTTLMQSKVELQDAEGYGESSFSPMPAGFKHREAFALIAQRLCGKGALSLSLAALCSKCRHVRQTAVSTLALFMAALHTKEAREAASWRERPQLSMLLNAVQRAMVIKSAHQFSSGQPSDASRQVPKLPGLVAIFLARASLIMSKPEDFLYVPLNRFFLKTEADHGAFQDTNRLPAFISLFCSSSDEAGQARKERIWALQLLQDGFIDESCYRLVATCHAPELILTSFDNIRARQATDDREAVESNLLLDAIRTLLEYGGRRATSHLVGRLGLLSWLRATLLCRPKSDIFLTTKMKVSYLKLVFTAAERACFYKKTRSEVLMQELSGLAEPIVELCADTGVIFGKRQGLQEPPGDPTLLPNVCNALNSLRVAITKLKEEGITYLVVRSDGITLTSSTSFLELVPPELMQSALFSLCCLPVRFEASEPKQASDFCTSVLDFVAAEDPDEEIVTAVLERTLLLATLFGDSFDTECHVLRRLVMTSRILLRTDQGQELWLKCLELLVATNQREGSFDEVYDVARDIVWGVRRSKVTK
jgi:hypothetical protein